MKKLFFTDKNNILRETQLLVRDELLKEMLFDIRSFYIEYHNPLGVMDDFMVKIQKTENIKPRALYDFYEQLAAIYRYKNDDGQLALLFDTKSHEEKYTKEWKSNFLETVKAFYCSKNFLDTVLKLSFFNLNYRKMDLAIKRLKSLLDDKLEMCVYKKQELKSTIAIRKLIAKNKKKKALRKNKKATHSN